MSARKKSDDQASEGEINKALEARLAAVEKKLDTLIQCVVTADAPARVKKRQLRVKTREPNAMAKRARIGRAAKRAGMTLEAWIDAYGETDRLP